MKKYEFNAKGMACPLPVIETKKLLEEYEVVETTVDNLIATQKMNYDIDTKKISDEEYIVTISDKGIKEVKVINTLDDSYVVVINKSIMGHGSEELGKKLMKSFIYTLTEQEILPKKIIFYNEGALLVDKTRSHVLKELQELEENGVEIMCCGACIDYYKVELAVGNSSNMYFIVEDMRTANRVVRP